MLTIISIFMYIHVLMFLISATKPMVTEHFYISPITGEHVPASKMADHMRYGM